MPLSDTLRQSCAFDRSPLNLEVVLSVPLRPSRSKGGTMFKRWCLFVGLALLTGACAGLQLRNNTSELAASIGGLTERQIFYNLAQSFRGRNFFPSHVLLSTGLAETTNTISPSLSVPLGTQVVQAAGATFGAASSSTANATYTYGAPGLSIGVVAVKAKKLRFSCLPRLAMLR